ncbi:MAG: hypothetical protein J6U20_03895 [Fibrobacter sp.]|nr:hypothetical protein [Fibrobacter sp.]
MKITVKEAFKSVLGFVEDRPTQEGAIIMYHFLNGILVGGSIDLQKEVRDTVDAVIVDELLKRTKDHET